MLTAEQIIQTICPKLADSPSLSQYVQMATESLDSRFFGKSFNYAVAYKACHFFDLYGDSDSLLALGGAGPVVAYREGGMDVSFARGYGDNELQSTKYGRMLLALIKAQPRMDVNRNCAPVIPIII